MTEDDRDEDDKDEDYKADSDHDCCLDLQLVIPAFLCNQQPLAEEKRPVNVPQAIVKLVLQNI